MSKPNTSVGLRPDESNPNLHLAGILCCLCGAKIQPNRANMCINCLKSQVDITEGISKQLTLFFCRTCGRYQGANNWVACELESRELLALCLKKCKGLNKDVKLVDAGFVWTEPHSRRVKVKLTIQKEVLNGVILQQVFVVEFIMQNQQCTDCQKSYTEHTWNTVVQVRQKVKHKRTFLFLEQLLLKHNVCAKAMGVKEQPGGLDFFWGHKNNANHLLAFLKNVVPMKDTSSKRLISQDDNSNTFNFKYTIYVEIAPICKDDVVVLEPTLAHQLGGVSPLMICHKVSSGLHLIDPLTLKFVEISGGTYWRYPFKPVMSAHQLIEFTVLNIEKADTATGEGFNKHNAFRDKLALAEVEVAKSSDFGVNDTTYTVLTHLGNWLKVGDLVMGYDFTGCNLPETAAKQLKDRKIPEIILIRKTYQNKKARAKKRKWELRHMDKARDDEKAQKKSELAQDNEDYERFMEELEEDPDMRAQVNLFKKKGVTESSKPRGADGKGAAGSKKAAATSDASMDEKEEEDDEQVDEEYPEVKMSELLDEFSFGPDNSKATPDSDDKDIDFTSPSSSSSGPAFPSFSAFPAFPAAPVQAESSKKQSGKRGKKGAPAAPAKAAAPVKNPFSGFD